ncbi:MAG: tetratricopeptide repeat protein [Bacteroidia bacterium]
MNNFLMRTFFLVLVLCCTVNTQAQTFKQQLAEQYKQNKEYDKAVELYKELYNDNAALYFNDYVTCLEETGGDKEAEKIIKKALKKDAKNTDLRLRLITHYIKTQNAEKANKELEALINDTPPDAPTVVGLGNVLNKFKLYDYTLKLYETKRKNGNEDYGYNIEMAQVYQYKGENERAIQEYVNLLEREPQLLEQTKSALQTLIGDDKESALKKALKSQLIKKINQEPDKDIYSDLLIWYFVQDKDFEQAFNQTKALDKRKHEEGQRVVNLASICNKNNDYATAINCYEYVLLKGKENFYYNVALAELANTRYNQLVNNANYTPADVQLVATTLTATTAELGKNESSFTVCYNYIQLLAYYLDKPKEAETEAENLLQTARVTPQQQAQLKLVKADALIMQGDVWESALLYGQVDKQFKEDPIGAEAKYRNAKLSFYKNDFEWAQAQLDVLKASTSKLIANDALYFSLLIQDNTVDSNFVPLSLFAKADLLLFQHKYDMAYATLDSINTLFPGHTLNDDVLYRKAQIELQRHNYTAATNYLLEITKTYYNDILMDDALFQLAQLQYNQFNDSAKASALYEEIITKHPGSIYATEARKQFRILRGDKLN